MTATGPAPGVRKPTLGEALAELAAAEQACRDVERRLSLPPWIFRKRLDAAMKRWTAANVAVFDAQVAEIFGAAADGAGR